MTKLFLKGIAQKDANGGITVVVSDESMDRAGDVISLESWDLTNFVKSPRMFVDHDYSVKSLTGVWTNPRIEDGKLKMTPVFHDITELARVNKEMVEQGFLNTTSVGYISHKGKDGKVRNELLEVSWVGVPCNANARVEKLEVKDIDGTEADAVEKWIKEAAPETAEKGIIDDTNAAAQELSEEKWPMLCAVWDAFNDFWCAWMNGATSADAFGAMIDDLCAMLTALKDGTQPINEADDEDSFFLSVQNMTTKIIASRKIKAGRVLSDANRTVIQTAIDSMESGTSALKELLNATDSSGADEAAGKSADNASEGAQRSKDAQFGSKDELKGFIFRRQVVQEINTLTADLLAEMRKRLADNSRKS